MEMTNNNNAEHFLDLIKRSKRGKFKIYIGMSAGVGKTYRMLQEAHALLRSGIAVQIGFVETHGRAETLALTDGLPVIPCYSAFYKGKLMEEMDLQAIINIRPEVVLIDELAHTNMPGSNNEKRWQDVLNILDAGINVISAVNIQHIESLHGAIKTITGIEVAERIPDKILKLADEVVNIDLTADELIARLKEGKIYTRDKVDIALRNFFKPESILQLRELALKEVAGQIERKVEAEIPRGVGYRHEKLLACISSNNEIAKIVIRKVARLASYYNAQWYVLYIETPNESADRIPLHKQRHLINNFKLAAELGADVLKIKKDKVANAIVQVAEEKSITTVCIGKPHLSLLQVILATSAFNDLLRKLSQIVSTSLSSHKAGRMLSIKTKTALGIGGLFSLLLAISIVAFVFINSLSDKTENLLTANYKTIQYCNEMMHAMDEMHLNGHAVDSFEKNLQLQENNITELGERDATRRLRMYFDKLKQGSSDTAVADSINKQIYDISLLNQHALERKNTNALDTAQTAKLWISVFGAIIILIGFTFAVNFPSYIAGPIKLLTEGIKEIALKNYTKRIYIENNDEFGALAQAFNSMAEKLYAYEHSSLSQLMFEKKRVDTIINQMEDAVFGLDANNKILFINHKAEGIFDLKANNIIGSYAPDVALYNDLLRIILQKNTKLFPLKIIVEGKENYFSIDFRTVYSEERTIGEVFTLKNITSFKELDISKTNLLATISHELKTPISSIKMSTKLITDSRVGQLNIEQKELVGNIEEDAERLLRITGELLNMTQIESGNIQLKLQKVAPGEIIDNSIQAVQLQAGQKNIQLQVNCPDDLPVILADADKTSWVLINFLTNAIRYSPENSNIILSAGPYKKGVRFAVQDFGIGIEEKYLLKIFDRYFKVPDGQVKTSTGLGLAISKEFINAQGGEIDVQSAFGKGSTFSFVLYGEAGL